VVTGYGYCVVNICTKKERKGGMNQTQLLKHLQFCKHKWNGWGEDVFQSACLIALERSKSLDRVNSSFFKLLCCEAARKLLRHRKYEILFTEFQRYHKNGSDNENDEFEIENLIEPNTNLE
jgi:hypothetical protein